MRTAWPTLLAVGIGAVLIVVAFSAARAEEPPLPWGPPPNAGSPPEILGADCGGNTSNPPHSLGPSFSASCCLGCCAYAGDPPVCIEWGCRELCAFRYGAGTPYLWDSVGGTCGCEPGGDSSPPGRPPPDPDPGDCEEGSGFCAPSELADTFGAQADNASQICNAESGGNPFALNDSCLCGTPQEGLVESANCALGPTGDYSVGLFQINLVVRCAAGIRQLNPLQCEIIDIDALRQCMDDFGYGNAQVNEEAAGVIYGGVSWCPWTTAVACGIATDC
ncbi:MAG: hypothetical protein A2991_00255 [Candidatus Terrybacteria bacterium RIFCSPLOWO2_01_FULL_58_14]|uniref:Transglycosylase SLT domain-containing protein n=2 Tax=Candidatus Terryibacteriota TaxID=1817920 RepID=A0A1G2PZT6_9BACT|nr:MAG: hypothetical protein A2682_01470 [Candidatus Terrybacteria bacterium RIFCSPHIGHO2_01_FULL_58_15]OHA53823.1 MAG: hypothetical protein A2991_00255 [Candidatus Terrybacteria bacterium RIFCSPLOWO2_01_FULL_58_14]